MRLTRDWHVPVGGLVLLACGAVALIGHETTSWTERNIIGSFGIRGIGSFYYLAYAIDEASFREYELILAREEIWAVVGFAVLVGGAVAESVPLGVLGFLVAFGGAALAVLNYKVATGAVEPGPAPSGGGRGGPAGPTRGSRGGRSGRRAGARSGRRST